MQTAVEILWDQCYFWQYLVCFLFYFWLPFSLHSIIYFSGETKECTPSLLISSAACGACGQSVHAASWKTCVLLKWSAEKHVLVELFQPLLLHSSQGLKCPVSNSPWGLHLPKKRYLLQLPSKPQRAGTLKMALCAFYAVWGLVLEVAIAFGPVPRITWEHKGKNRNLSIAIWDIATSSGFLWDLKLTEALGSCSQFAVNLVKCCYIAHLMKCLRAEYSKVIRALGWFILVPSRSFENSCFGNRRGVLNLAFSAEGYFNWNLIQEKIPIGVFYFKQIIFTWSSDTLAKCSSLVNNLLQHRATLSIK